MILVVGSLEVCSKWPHSFFGFVTSCPVLGGFLLTDHTNIKWEIETIMVTDLTLIIYIFHYTYYFWVQYTLTASETYLLDNFVEKYLPPLKTGIASVCFSLPHSSFYSFPPAIP